MTLFSFLDSALISDVQRQEDLIFEEFARLRLKSHNSVDLEVWTNRLVRVPPTEIPIWSRLQTASESLSPWSSSNLPSHILPFFYDPFSLDNISDAGYGQT